MESRQRIAELPAVPGHPQKPSAALENPAAFRGHQADVADPAARVPVLDGTADGGLDGASMGTVGSPLAAGTPGAASPRGAPGPAART